MPLTWYSMARSGPGSMRRPPGLERCSSNRAALAVWTSPRNCCASRASTPAVSSLARLSASSFMRSWSMSTVRPSIAATPVISTTTSMSEIPRRICGCGPARIPTRHTTADWHALPWRFVRSSVGPPAIDPGGQAHRRVPFARPVVPAQPHCQALGSRSSRRVVLRDLGG